MTIDERRQLGYENFMPVVEPSQAVRDFFTTNIFGRDELVLVIKSSGGASINVDGPFTAKVFDWSKRRRDDEYVIQPKWAELRASGESNVHMHLSGAILSKELWLRLWYAGTPYIDQSVRICFFTVEPKPDNRGEELFWFYAFAHGEKRHPLCDSLPAFHAMAGSSEPTLSKALRIDVQAERTQQPKPSP
jgi:hypothetical protein